MDHFELISSYQPTGDQPEAIQKLVEGFRAGNQFETLLGVTGSGKTFTMANVIAAMNKPTLVISHNKTLAAQLYSEFREFFPHNAVEYFVSYYDYYQPEAYVPQSDTYIAKDSSVNDEIDRMRLSATAALTERRDVIVVASVSCIYGLGSPDDYEKMSISLRPGMEKGPQEVCDALTEIHYDRSDDLQRGCFRLHGDVLEVNPAEGSDYVLRIEFFGDEVDRITQVEPVTGRPHAELRHVDIFPASHYVVPKEKIDRACDEIEAELKERVRYFKSEGKLLEAQRIAERTNFDIEMMRETGFCSGIENYSRPLSGRAPGSAPMCLMDFFRGDYMIMVDESHITIPQIGAMYHGDQSRKKTLVDYGFRLPSAMDNRPLSFEEFEQRIDQMLFASATPGPYEAEHELLRAEQIIRPTGLLDPEISVRPTAGQIDDLISENLTEYLAETGIRVKYLHSDIDTLERAQIIRDMRLDVFDVLVGINLLREGLDIPEISLVAILDADKEGFLRNETSLIQTIGRASRNAEGHVIMYADTVTESMHRAIEETARRRRIQTRYNEEHHITPQTIRKAVRDLITVSQEITKENAAFEKDPESMSADELKKLIGRTEKQMRRAATDLNFEAAAELRDQLIELKKHYNIVTGGKG